MLTRTAYPVALSYLVDVLGGAETALPAVSAAHDRLPRRYTTSAAGAVVGRLLGRRWSTTDHDTDVSTAGRA